MTLTEAIRELTQPWNEILPPDDDRDGYTVIDHKPRIHILRDLIGSSSGGTTAGGTLASNRNLVNVPALDLWQRIDEQTRAALEQYGKRPKRELADALDQLGTDGDALRATNDMTEIDHSRLTAKVERWKADIENLYDPATKKEIKSACPGCGVERVETAEGESWALSAYYWKGQEPAATCAACARHWQGSRALLELGYSIQANVDHDELRALGVA